MNQYFADKPATLSVVIPCFNEEGTLQACIERLLAIGDEGLKLQVIVVDDCSTDNSLSIAEAMAREHPELVVVHHRRNRGKGAALRAGFERASSDIVAVQDADLEYNPQDLRRLIQPILDDEADVVFGSRFAFSGAHRVLYFWHSLGNQFLTLLSNMFTDLNMTDMECGYKVFRRDVIADIRIDEERFGVEPELVAKVAQKRVRIFEMGVSYSGRTYAEGKKIGYRDGLRALYCIFRYNAPKLPLALQILIYAAIGGTAALVNIAAFLILMSQGVALTGAILVAFFTAAAINYFLCILVLFRHKSQWNTPGEILAYIAVILAAAVIDYSITTTLLGSGWAPLTAKALSALLGFGLNFAGRKYFVFREPATGPWKPQTK